MSLQVLPNYPRGELIVDPNFYTSTLFVDPLRQDIQNLLESFKEKYLSSTPPRRVFSLFQDVWNTQGWNYFHLSVIEDVDRDVFLTTTFRLFTGEPFVPITWISN